MKTDSERAAEPPVARIWSIRFVGEFAMSGTADESFATR